jgi:hypothetical protein
MPENAEHHREGGQHRDGGEGSVREKPRNAHAPLCAVRTLTTAGRATSLPLTTTTLPLDRLQIGPHQNNLFPGRAQHRGSELKL